MNTELQINELISKMSLKEKIGQLCLTDNSVGSVSEELRMKVANGEIGAILNDVNPETIRELQRIAVEESPLGIPLLFGRDVIHGFKTVFPIPLGQAASWNPDLIRKSAEVSALEAASIGINWTFAPMLDIGRDPRWGRIAETLGEDPFLTSVLGKAMIKGFQGDDLSNPKSIAACAKHFAGYGASEAGRDYNSTNITERDLRSIHLPPFKAAVDADIASFMVSFSDMDGIPASANTFLLKDVLRNEWKFNGFVVSDWESIKHLSVHGITLNDKESALESAKAGLDMDMQSNIYSDYLESLVAEGKISVSEIDVMVANILRIKFRKGLFSKPYNSETEFPPLSDSAFLDIAKEAAIKSIVLLRNEDNILPLSVTDINSIAVIGPLADDDYEQLGTWIFDGDIKLTQTPLNSLKSVAQNRFKINYVKTLETTRSKDNSHFEEALDAAKKSDAVLLFLGEESILSGEAHCRADIRLPGIQEALIEKLTESGKPIIVVILAGRPLALKNIVDKVDAVLYAWHPGTMGGPAITDILFGKESPSGKLPVTFPKAVGQIPIYYSHKNTGRPASPETFMYIDDIPPRCPQVSTGNTSFHLDTGYTPLYPFGFGLSYTTFKYSNIKIENAEVKIGGTLIVSAEIYNEGNIEAEETAQCYIRDITAQVTRPVKELKGFTKVRIKPKETVTVTFRIHTDELAYYDRRMNLITDPGIFHVWVGGDSEAPLQSQFVLIE